MRTLLSILALFFCLNLLAQKPQSSSVFPSAEEIIAFVDANMGKKVSDGICLDLVREANGGGTWYGKKWINNKKYRVRKPQIGDAITFEGVVYYDSNKKRHEAKSHIGIVYKILEDGNIILAHQNAGVKRPKDSKVVLCQMNYKKIKCGKIKFYRFN